MNKTEASSLYSCVGAYSGLWYRCVMLWARKKSENQAANRGNDNTPPKPSAPPAVPPRPYMYCQHYCARNPREESVRPHATTAGNNNPSICFAAKFLCWQAPSDPRSWNSTLLFPCGPHPTAINKPGKRTNGIPNSQHPDCDNHRLATVQSIPMFQTKVSNHCDECDRQHNPGGNQSRLEGARPQSTLLGLRTKIFEFIPTASRRSHERPPILQSENSTTRLSLYYHFMRISSFF